MEQNEEHILMNILTYYMHKSELHTRSYKHPNMHIQNGFFRDLEKNRRAQVSAGPHQRAYGPADLGRREGEVGPWPTWFWPAGGRGPRGRRGRRQERDGAKEAAATVSGRSGEAGGGHGVGGSGRIRVVPTPGSPFPAAARSTGDETLGGGGGGSAAHGI